MSEQPWTQPEPSYVIVLTGPGGQRRLSHASLMTREEADGEAAQWREMRPDGVRWAVDVREVR